MLFRSFHRQTEPVIGFYMRSGLLQVVDGEGRVEDIADRIGLAARDIPSSTESAGILEATIL